MIVGRGGVFVTRHMPGGIHVQLVAPLETCILNSMKHYKLDREAAEKRVEEITRNREEFFRRYGCAQTPMEDLFSVTFNTAHVSEEKIAEMLMPLIPSPESL